MAAAAVALAPPLISARENYPNRFFLIPTTKEEEGVEKLFFSNYDGGKFIVISLN